jgi:hypothetical protein
MLSPAVSHSPRSLWVTYCGNIINYEVDIVTLNKFNARKFIQNKFIAYNRNLFYDINLSPTNVENWASS